MGTLYAFTTPSESSMPWNSRRGVGLIKVGYTEGDVVRRVRGCLGQGTSTPNEYTILLTKELPKGITDTIVHKYLEKLSITRATGTEWFECSIEEVELAYELALKKARVVLTPNVKKRVKEIEAMNKLRYENFLKDEMGVTDDFLKKLNDMHEKSMIEKLGKLGKDFAEGIRKQNKKITDLANRVSGTVSHKRIHTISTEQFDDLNIILNGFSVLRKHIDNSLKNEQVTEMDLVLFRVLQALEYNGPYYTNWKRIRDKVVALLVQEPERAYISTHFNVQEYNGSVSFRRTPAVVALDEAIANNGRYAPSEEDLKRTQEEWNKLGNISTNKTQKILEKPTLRDWEA